MAIFGCSAAEAASVELRLLESASRLEVRRVDRLEIARDADVVVVGTSLSTAHGGMERVRKMFTEGPAVVDASTDNLSEAVRRSLKLRRAEMAMSGDPLNGRILEEAQIGVWLIGADGETLLANRAMATMLGRDSLDGIAVGTVLASSDRPTNGDVLLRRADGTIVPALMSTTSLFDDDGSAIGTVAFVTDISARKKAEDELRRREAQMTIAQHIAKLGSWERDLESDIVEASPEFWSIFGREPRRLVSFDELLSFIHPDDVARVRLAGLASRETGEPLDVEHRVIHPGGKVVVVHARGEIIRDFAGTARRVVGVVQDITRRKELEAELERDKRLAGLGHLAASVAHEFNNVLMSILPFAELLKRQINDDRVRTATEQIATAVRRGRSISQEILRFARPARPTLAPLNIIEWMTNFAREASALAGPKIDLLLDTGDAAGRWILADRTMIDQVATNLVINARDAMPRGGTIALSARLRASGEIEIDVRDTGSGIAGDHIDHLFDPLFTTKPSGTGLGLSIAYQAMQLQGGSLRVNSRLGEGSTFSMTFRESPAPDAKNAGGSSDASRRLRLVLVEDDEAVGEGLRALLTDEGFDVGIATNGSDAVKQIAANVPDVVILDVNLPDMSGLQVYDLLHEKWPGLPVIFSTGYADARSVEGVRRRRLPTIMKPYDVEQLVKLIREQVR